MAGERTDESLNIDKPVEPEDTEARARRSLRSLREAVKTLVEEPGATTSEKELVYVAPAFVSQLIEKFYDDDDKREEGVYPSSYYSVELEVTALDKNNSVPEPADVEGDEEPINVVSFRDQDISTKIDLLHVYTVFQNQMKLNNVDLDEFPEDAQQRRFHAWCKQNVVEKDGVNYILCESSPHQKIKLTYDASSPAEGGGSITITVTDVGNPKTKPRTTHTHRRELFYKTAHHHDPREKMKPDLTTLKKILGELGCIEHEDQDLEDSSFSPLFLEIYQALKGVLKPVKLMDPSEEGAGTCQFEDDQGNCVILTSNTFKENAITTLSMKQKDRGTYIAFSLQNRNEVKYIVDRFGVDVLDVVVDAYGGTSKTEEICNIVERWLLSDLATEALRLDATNRFVNTILTAFCNDIVEGERLIAEAQKQKDLEAAADKIKAEQAQQLQAQQVMAQPEGEAGVADKAPKEEADTEPQVQMSATPVILMDELDQDVPGKTLKIEPLAEASKKRKDAPPSDETTQQAKRPRVELVDQENEQVGNKSPYVKNKEFLLNSQYKNIPDDDSGRRAPFGMTEDQALLEFVQNSRLQTGGQVDWTGQNWEGQDILDFMESKGIKSRSPKIAPSTEKYKPYRNRLAGIKRRILSLWEKKRIRLAPQAFSGLNFRDKHGDLKPLEWPAVQAFGASATFSNNIGI